MNNEVIVIDPKSYKLIAGPYRNIRELLQFVNIPQTVAYRHVKQPLIKQRAVKMNKRRPVLITTQPELDKFLKPPPSVKANPDAEYVVVMNEQTFGFGNLEHCKEIKRSLHDSSAKIITWQKQQTQLPLVLLPA